MTELQVMQKCLTVFENLGWSVGQEEKVEGYPYRFDIVLRHNEKIYGFVEVVAKETLKQKAEFIDKVLGEFIQEYKPMVFIITNGFAFDVYHFGEFYGSLTVPPTPEDVDILFGGEEE